MNVSGFDGNIFARIGCSLVLLFSIFSKTALFVQLWNDPFFDYLEHEVFVI